MREDNAYDAIPNFTAADAVRVVGIGRNEYISVMQQAKSKKLLWRMNKGIVKDLLPEEPRPPAPEPWWTLHLVNLGEVEYRSLTKPEVDVCQMAAERGGARCSDVDPLVLEDLYRKGLVWLEVPIAPGDHLSIPPLEVCDFCTSRVFGAHSEDDLYPISIALLADGCPPFLFSFSIIGCLFVSNSFRDLYPIEQLPLELKSTHWKPLCINCSWRHQTE